MSNHRETRPQGWRDLLADPTAWLALALLLLFLLAATPAQAADTSGDGTVAPPAVLTGGSAHDSWINSWAGVELASVLYSGIGASSQHGGQVVKGIGLFGLVFSGDAPQGSRKAVLISVSGMIAVGALDESLSAHSRTQGQILAVDMLAFNGVFAWAYYADQSSDRPAHPVSSGFTVTPMPGRGMRLGYRRTF